MLNEIRVYCHWNYSVLGMFCLLTRSDFVLIMPNEGHWNWYNSDFVSSVSSSYSRQCTLLIIRKKDTFHHYFAGEVDEKHDLFLNKFRYYFVSTSYSQMKVLFPTPPETVFHYNSFRALTFVLHTIQCFSMKLVLPWCVCVCLISYPFVWAFPGVWCCIIPVSSIYCLSHVYV